MNAARPSLNHSLLAGQVALITGASRGIGAAVARLLTRQRAQVVLTSVFPSAAKAALAVVQSMMHVRAKHVLRMGCLLQGGFGKDHSRTIAPRHMMI